MLMRSLQRALHKDEAGRRITDPVAGPLFSDEYTENDQAVGTIYVLRSKSDHPLVAANRDLVHKIPLCGLCCLPATATSNCCRLAQVAGIRSMTRPAGIPCELYLWRSKISGA